MIFGYPIWAVIVICVGVFLASFVDAIGGGGGIISLPTYLIAGMPMHFALGTGKLTAKKGLKTGTYKVKVKLTAPASESYEAAKAKTIKVEIKVA